MLFVCSDGVEIAVVYYRNGYVPAHFTSEVVGIVEILNIISTFIIHKKKFGVLH